MKTKYFLKPGMTIGEAKRKVQKYSQLYFLISISLVTGKVTGQTVLFNFDSAPIHTSLPISQTVEGITATFSATGQGYSIQEANVLGFTPQGFSGNVIYPNSINLADLLIRFDKELSSFSMMYSCQELGCDDAATMRVTAYNKGVLVGTNTKTASNPGTWPVDLLSYNSELGFDSVVIHYDSHPPTCQDYGVIYMADNMNVTLSNATSVKDMNRIVDMIKISNPAYQSATVSFFLNWNESVKVEVYDITGRLVKNLFEGPLGVGEHKIKWNIEEGSTREGIYLVKFSCKNFSQTSKILVAK